MRSKTLFWTVLSLPLVIAGCPAPEPPGDVIIVPDDDDDATADDDDATADDDDATADDDDATADDDDSTPETVPITLQIDAPPGTIVAVQSGDGPFTEVTLTDMDGTADIAHPDGHYGVLLACAGPTRAGVQLHLSDAITEPNVVMGCAEAVERAASDGQLSGQVLNTEDQVWSLYLGSRYWASLPGTLNNYQAPLPTDNYDLIAARRDSNGVPNKVMLVSVLDAGNDPLWTIDFNDDASQIPHQPELATLDIAATGTSTNTTGSFLSRGGTLWNLGARPSPAASFEVIANERRFYSDMFFFTTSSTHDETCVGKTLTVLTSARMEDFNTAIARHGAPLVPVSPELSARCSDLTGLSVTSDASSLSSDWTSSLGADHGRDTLILELTAPDGASRWTVTSDVDRPVMDVDFANATALLGGSYLTPTTGWTWTATAWELPVEAVTSSQLALVQVTNQFTSIPTGRSRWQYEPLPLPGPGVNEERNHEYDTDDLTRVFTELPWDEIEYSAHGIQRSGTL
ncbi:MAG: hypothetical protein KDA24_22590 [Deltaproteobacteria bacterium]|nr:hypothetical protein [Deltaproteobacteria bacterium]